MTTDTPRTDAAQLWHFDEPVVPKEFAQQLERELAHSLENQVKSQAEVAELRQQKINCLEIIDDDAKERSELKAEVEFWKAKAHEAEDQEGKHEAEVEHIKALLKDIPAVHTNTLRGNIATLSWDSYEHIIGPHPCRERAENAEDDLIRTQIEMQLEIDKAEAEVERLKEQLKRAVEIADKIWADCSNGSEHTEIAALKGKIK